MRIIIDYKATKALSGLDWETIKNRYDEITNRFKLQYPKPESGSDQGRTGSRIGARAILQ